MFVQFFKSFRYLRHALLLGMVGFSSTVYAQNCTTKIGAVLPTSVDWGRPIAETAQFAVDLANDAGGVAGCQVEMILRDTQVDPKVGVDAKALVDLEKVPVLLGAVSSGVTIPILTSVAVPAGVMEISCCPPPQRSQHFAEEGKTKGLWFRTFATWSTGGVGTMLARDQGYKSVVVLYKNDDWGQDISKLTVRALESLGINVTNSIAINDGQASYRAEVTEALKGNPEGIYMALYPKEGISVVREWLSLGGSQNMIMANSMKSDEFKDSVGLKYLKNAGVPIPPHQELNAPNLWKWQRPDLILSKQTRLGQQLQCTMVALLAMAAGPNASGAQIAAQVGKVTDPNGILSRLIRLDLKRPRKY